MGVGWWSRVEKIRNKSEGQRWVRIRVLQQIVGLSVKLWDWLVRPMGGALNEQLNEATEPMGAR